MAVLFDDPIGLEAARQDRIDANLGRGFLRQRLSHRDHSRAQGVRQHKIVDRLMCGDRGEVHDRAATASQRGKGGAGQADGAHQHQVDRIGPRGVVQLGNAAQDWSARVVDEHFEAAQGRRRPLDEVAALVSLPEIGDSCDDVMTLLTKAFGGGTDALLVARRDDDATTLRGQRPGGRKSEATAGCRHQRAPSSQSRFHGPNTRVRY